MDQLNVIANFYHNLGFNVTHISLGENEYHKNLKTTLYHWDVKLKAPSHDWESYYKKKQSLPELNEMDWEKAHGLGVVLGIKNIRALDIDDCSDIPLIHNILSILNLPSNYEWVVKSGSKKGFHILFYAENHNYKTVDGKIRAFKPNLIHSNNFKHIELRWHGHLVLPPSIHPSFNRYEFLNKSFPYNQPAKIEIDNLENMVDKYCRNSPQLLPKTQIIKPTDTSATYLDDEELEESKYTSTAYIDDEELKESTNTSTRYMDVKYEKPFYLFFDTETTGIPRDWNAPITDYENWPRLVQLAWLLYDTNGNLISQEEVIIKPNGFSIPIEASNVHGISTAKALECGIDIELVLKQFEEQCLKSKFLVAHNINFDSKVMASEFMRNFSINPISELQFLCTMESATDFCKIEGYYGYKWPKLSELHLKLFGVDFDGAHDALADIEATARCFWEMRKQNLI